MTLNIGLIVWISLGMLKGSRMMVVSAEFNIILLPLSMPRDIHTMRPIFKVMWGILYGLDPYIGGPSRTGLCGHRRCPGRRYRLGAPASRPAAADSPRACPSAWTGSHHHHPRLQ